VFPQFILVPFSQEHKKRLGRFNPSTTARLGFNYTNRPEYIRNSLNSSMIFNWQKERRRVYNLTLPEISLINTPYTRSDFDSLLLVLESEGNQLARSFNPSFVSNINFFLMFNFNPNDLYGNRSSLLKLYGEAGGTMFALFEPEFLKARNLEYYKYVKFSADFRRHISINPTNGLAVRVNMGLAVPYGENQALPYEKYFFAGGSNSIRAWQPRRLGPGSRRPGENPDPKEQGLFDYRFEQPGEILLEASAEYRSKLIGFLDWAFFIDAGNVWRLYKQQLQPGAEFQFNRFYKEIALGTGLGLRLNFSFLVIRFDYGIKVYDPARAEGERWLLDNISLSSPGGEPGQAIWNIAIGYPF
jgi:outer membrane protein insertion porin family